MSIVPWWAYLAAGAIAGALLAGGLQQARVASVKTQLAELRTQHAQLVADAALAKAAAHAEALAIKRELSDKQQALQDTINQQDEDARHAEKQRLAAAAAHTATERRLRDRLDTIARAASAADRVKTIDDSRAAAQRETASAASGVLAELLGRCSERAGIVARYADAAHAAGQRCERAYDTAREAMIPAVK